MMDRMRPMIARALREMEERLRAEKTIPAVERIKPKAREKRISGITLEKTPRLMRRPTTLLRSPIEIVFILYQGYEFFIYLTNIK